MVRQKGGNRRRKAARERKAWQPYERGFREDRRANEEVYDWRMQQEKEPPKDV